ncbi:MAG: hypothetical protein CMJ65_07430 [Planctomycetaceae bacterium]|nr:hypothetical protein [Planctomycetaceae bacterium]
MAGNVSFWDSAINLATIANLKASLGFPAVARRRAAIRYSLTRVSTRLAIDRPLSTLIFPRSLISSAATSCDGGMLPSGRTIPSFRVWRSAWAARFNARLKLPAAEAARDCSRRFPTCATGD